MVSTVLSPSAMPPKATQISCTDFRYVSEVKTFSLQVLRVSGPECQPSPVPTVVAGRLQASALAICSRVPPTSRGRASELPHAPPPPAPRPVGSPVCLARLSCSRGLGLLPWLCDGTVGVRGALKSSQHSCVRVCVLARHHVRTALVSGWGPTAVQTLSLWKGRPGENPPPTHPVSIRSCHSPLDSALIGYVLVSSLPLWLILIHLIYQGG